MSVAATYDDVVRATLGHALEALDHDVHPDDFLPRLARELVAARREFSDDVRSEITPAVRALVFRRDGFQCVECAEPNVYVLSVDHRTPVALGGGNEPENLRTLCRSCNSRNGARLS